MTAHCYMGNNGEVRVRLSGEPVTVSRRPVNVKPQTNTKTALGMKLAKAEAWFYKPDSKKPRTWKAWRNTQRK
jgi:hypothetical protein